MAVKLIGEPAQVGLEPKVIAAEIVGEGDAGAIVMVVPALVAPEGLAQVAFDVMVQTTTSLSFKVLEV